MSPPTKLPNSALFSDTVASIAGTGLDSSQTLPANSHPPALVQKSAASTANHPKADIVVAVVALPDVVVAVSRTAVIGIVVPGTAAQLGLPAPLLMRVPFSLAPTR